MPPIDATLGPDGYTVRPIASSGSGQIALPSSTLNLTKTGLVAALLPIAAAAKAAVVAGTADMIVLFVGDSETAGSGALGANVTADLAAYAVPTIFAQRANRTTCPVQAHSWFGNQNMAANYDARRDYGPFVTSNVITLGGASFQSNGAGSLSTTFRGIVDTVDAYFPVNGGLGTFNISRGATTGANRSQSGSQSVGKQTLTAAGASNVPFKLNWVSGSIYMFGLLARNSAIKQVQVVQAGVSGSVTSDWTSDGAGYGQAAVIDALKPQLSIVRPLVNEVLNGVPVATAQANLDAYIKRLLQYGDVILQTFFPVKQNRATLEVQKTYVDAIYAVAAANPRVLLDDLWSRVGSWENGVAYDFYDGSDEIHPYRGGYRACGEGLASLFLAL